MISCNFESPFEEKCLMFLYNKPTKKRLDESGQLYSLMVIRLFKGRKSNKYLYRQQIIGFQWTY